MATRSGVQFGSTGVNAVAGILDGILQGIVMRRQFQQQDAEESRKERMFALQKRTFEDAERRRREAEFPPPPTTRDIGQDVEQSLRERFLAADQAAQGREDVLQQQAFKTSAADLAFQRGLVKQGTGIEQRGVEARLTRQTPTPGRVEAPPTPEDLAAIETKSLTNQTRRLKSFRTGTRIPGLESVNPINIDTRFGPDLLDRSVAVAEGDPELEAGEVVKNSMAEGWAKAVIDQAEEEKAFKSGQLDPKAEVISDDARKFGITRSDQPLTLDGQPVTGPMLNSLLEGANFEDGPKDLEDIAFTMLGMGKSEQEFRDFVKNLFVDPNAQEFDRKSAGLDILKGLTPLTAGAASLGTAIGQNIRERFQGE